MQFSDDIDLLKWEPELFGELGWKSQILCQDDDGALQGSTFSSAASNFTTSGIKAGKVICLYDSQGKIDGCYEVVSVNSATELTISVLRAGGNDAVVPPPTDAGAGAITFRICTYSPQAEVAAELLLDYFGIGLSDSLQQEVVNAADLRLASVFGVLSAVFEGLYDNKDSIVYRDKSQYYRGMYHLVRDRLKLQLDSDNDGVADRTINAGEINIYRA